MWKTLTRVQLKFHAKLNHRVVNRWRYSEAQIEFFKKLVHSLAPGALWPTATLKQQHSIYIFILFMVTQAYFQF